MELGASQPALRPIQTATVRELPLAMRECTSIKQHLKRRESVAQLRIPGSDYATAAGRLQSRRESL